LPRNKNHVAFNLLKAGLSKNSNVFAIFEIE
jgi:hypothetical protein